MHIKILLLLIALASDRIAFAAPPRIAILPLEPSSGQLQVADLKNGGATIADYLSVQLRDFPRVEWVERADLDKLLAEASFESRADDRVSSIALGRLLKADYIIRGNLNALSDKAVGVNVEVVDLTNADVFSSKQACKCTLPTPGHFAMDENTLRAIADTTRGLLAKAIETTRTSTNKITLAPILFANTSSNKRLDTWEDQFMRDLEEAARSRGGFRLLHFPGATEAGNEQQLALLGLTDADPLAWRHAAQGYLWGNYHELPAKTNTAFDDIQVQVEVHFWVGDQTRVLTRTFAVKDFANILHSLATEVIAAAAQSQHPPLGQEAATKVSDEIYGHICDVINQGIFRSDSALQGTTVLPFSQSTFVRVESYESYMSKINFTTRMLGLACFFDPLNPRKQLIRLMYHDHTLHSAALGTNRTDLDAHFSNTSQALDYFDRLQHQLHPSELLSNLTMDYFFKLLDPYYLTNARSLSQDPLPKLTDAHKAERQKLLARFQPYMNSYTAALLRRHPADNASLDLADHWLRVVMDSDLKPESRLEFLQTVWPMLDQTHRKSRLTSQRDTYSTPSDWLSARLDRLMADLGDRKRVQNILVLADPSAPKEPPLSDIKALETMALHPSLASDRHGDQSHNPLLKDVTAVQAMCFRSLPGSSSFSVSNMYGVGDQLLIEWVGDGHQRMFPNYRLSTEACEPISGTWDPVYGRWDPFARRTVCVAYGRRYCLSSGTLEWTDMLSGESGKFTVEQGMPVLNSASVGSAGGRYTVMAGLGGKNNDRIVGLFDWKVRKWFTPPPPPQTMVVSDVKRPLSAPATNPRSLHIVGNDDWILFVEWSLVYHISAHTYTDASPALSHAFDEAPGDALSPNQEIAFTDGIVTDGDFWLWGRNGIAQYSPPDNRVIWSSRTIALSSVVADGPYLWLLFVQPDLSDFLKMTGHMPAMPLMLRKEFDNKSSQLLLFERSRHQPMSTVAIPRIVTTCCVTNHVIFLGCIQSNQPENDALLCSEKEDIFAAFDLLSSQPQLHAARPAYYESGNSPLYEAILREDVSTVGKLLAGGVSPNNIFGSCHTPALIIATWTRNKEIVQLLLDHGANPNTSGERLLDPSELWHKHRIENPSTPMDQVFPPEFKKTGWTALTTAARLRNPALVRLLLKAGANPSPPDAECSPLTEAARYQNTDVVELLVKAGAPLVTFNTAGTVTGGDVIAMLGKNNDSATASRLLTLNPPLPAASRSALEHIAQPDALIPAEQAAAADMTRLSAMLRDAITTKREERALLLARLIPFDQLHRDDIQKAFSSAITADCRKLVAAMLNAGVDPNQSPKDPWGISIQWLHVALAAGRNDMIKLLLDHGANPRLLDEQTGLFIEDVIGSMDDLVLVEKLLNYYPPLDTKFGYGTLGGDMLCWAIRAQKVRNVMFLLDHGVPATATDRVGYSALHRFSTLEMRCLLAGAGADIHARDTAGHMVYLSSYRTNPHVPGALDPHISTSGSATAIQSYDPPSDIAKKGRDILLLAAQNTSTFQDLFDAVSSNDIARARDLLDRGAPAYREGSSLHKPGLLFLAASSGSLEMAQLLIQHGCNPSMGEGGGTGDRPSNDRTYYWPSIPKEGFKTPLIVAAEKGNTAMVNLLLDAGAYAPALDQYRRNAVDAAATPELAGLIKERSRLQFIAATFFSAPYDKADYEALRAALRQAPALAGIRNAQRITLYQQLTRCYEGSPINAKALAIFHEYGIKPNFLDSTGMTMLHRAVINGNAKEVAELITAGFDPMLPDSRGITALELAQGILNETLRAQIIGLFHSGGTTQVSNQK